MCRQPFATGGSWRTSVRFILPSLPVLVDQPSPLTATSKLHRDSVSASAASASGACRRLGGVGGDGTPPMEGAMEGDGMTAGRVVRMGVGSDGIPIEGAMEGHRGALSMCFRRFDAGPVSTLAILPAVNNRSMATRKASADTPFASGSPANSKGALPRPVDGRTGRPWAMRLSSNLRKSSSTLRSAAAR
jgi:hypothetical protein